MTCRRGLRWLALCCALGLAFAGSAGAGRILVPVHGYLGDSASWQQSGVLPVLEEAGWRVAGNLRSTPSGVRLEPVGRPAGEFAIYTVDLPSTAPLMVQAHFLGGIKRWLVERKVGDDIYRTVQSSRGVLADLSPPVPGNLLYWLNARPHPDIAYVGVVRGAAIGMPGDQVVPAPSQDLRRVPALGGRAGIEVVAGDHQLGRQYGLLLSQLVAKPVKTAATDSE